MPGKKTDPKAVRPKMPKEYGIPKDKKGLLPWSHVEERMAKARHYWIATVSSSGRPFATPIDGLWIEGKLYFGGSPETLWKRNLKANPAASLHLESPTDVVILHGDATEAPALTPDFIAQLQAGSKEKYGYAPPAEMYQPGGVMVFEPRIAVAWSQFPKDVTRWELNS